MKISKQGNYGLRAAYELACNYEKEFLSARQISERQNIPLLVLEQLLFQLYKYGIVEMKIGPPGNGYKLSDEPDKVCLGDIFRTLEGPFQIAGCITSGEKGHCHREEYCLSLVFWNKFEQEIERLLDGYSLGDLTRLTRTARPFIKE